jgi:transposase-like protein
MEHGARLRRRVLAQGPRGRGSRIPDALRDELVAYARGRQAGGASLKQIARETGITRETIRNWLRAPERGARALVPVAIVPEVVAHDAVVVVSPGGYRVEGLDVATAAALLRLLA